MQELTTDFTLIWDPEYTTHPARWAFVDHMIGRAFGQEEVSDAWQFFKAGWEACHG